MRRRTFSRSRFLTAPAAGIAGIAFVRGRAAAAQFDYKLGDTIAIEHPQNVGLIEMAGTIRRETGGRLNIEVFPNSLLGGDTAMMTQLRVGAIQFYVGTQALSGLSPLLAIANVPFAFKSEELAFAAFDGALGEYLRREIEAKGLFPFPHLWDAGFREITTSTKPIRVPADLVGLKIRTPTEKIYVELFRLLGASPTPMNFAELYTALQTHLVEAQENPYAIIETSRLFEVQRFLSVTNHTWSASWFTANPAAWKALPGDIQDVVLRNARKYALLQRRDTMVRNASTADKLRRQGLAFNSVNVAPFRAQIAPLYASLRAEFGPAVWDLLEQYAGPLRAGA